jgi:hypothetical protein
LEIEEEEIEQKSLQNILLQTFLSPKSKKLVVSFLSTALLCETIVLSLGNY